MNGLGLLATLLKHATDVCTRMSAFAWVSVFLLGCAHGTKPPLHPPAAHPVLDTADWLQADGPVSPRQRVTAKRGPTPERPITRTIVKNLDKIGLKRFTTPGQSPDFLRAAFADTPIHQALRKVTSVSEARLLTEPIRGRFRPGDLVFFQAVPNMTPVAVLRRRRADGTLELIGIVRGGVRNFKAHIQFRSRRRSKGRVLNTFLRVKQPGDPRRTPYLAGQLVTAVRRLPTEIPPAKAQPARRSPKAQQREP